MKIKTTLGILFLSIFITGCTSISAPLQLIKKGEYPGINNVVTKSVGEAIYEDYNYTTTKGALLKTNINESYMLGKIEMLVNETLIARQTSKGDAYCSTRKVYIDPIVGAYDGACFFDYDNNLTFEKAFVPSIKLGATSILDYEASYEVVEIKTVMKGFKTQLLFQGLIGDELKLEYREFSNDLARPAFYQNVSYDLSTTKTLTFKGIKLEILNIDNNGLTYKVISTTK
jgi:hypothetical protein